jgi:hypothetical protein
MNTMQIQLQLQQIQLQLSHGRFRFYSYNQGTALEKTNSTNVSPEMCLLTRDVSTKKRSV